MKNLKSLMVAGLFVLLMQALNLQAQIGEAWNPAGNPTQPSDGLWSTAANWASGVVPVTGYKAFLNVNPVIPCVVNGVAGGCQISIGDGGPGLLIVTNGGNLSAGDTQIPGGSLSNNGWTGIGTTSNGVMIVESGGSVTFNYHCWIGLNTGANGTFIMNGGTATVTNIDPLAGPASFGIGTGGGTGIAHLYGGTLSVFNDHIRLPNAGTQIDLAGGTLIIVYNGDVTDTWDPFIAAKQIVGYEGNGTVNVNTSVSGETVLTGVPPVNTPPQPQPINSVSVQPGGLVTITYDSTIGDPYHIVSSTTLTVASANWTAVPGSTTNATAAITTFSYSNAGTAAQFYRVVSP